MKLSDDEIEGGQTLHIGGLLQYCFQTGVSRRVGKGGIRHFSRRSWV